MKYRIEFVLEDESGVEMHRIVAMEKQCGATDTPICGLGLTIIAVESKFANVARAIMSIRPVAEENTIDLSFKSKTSNRWKVNLSTRCTWKANLPMQKESASVKYRRIGTASS